MVGLALIGLIISTDGHTTALRCLPKGWNYNFNANVHASVNNAYAKKLQVDTMSCGRCQLKLCQKAARNFTVSSLYFLYVFNMEEVVL
mmetsp:Transcript_12429/g.21982  ORF Transcript_12429/g.21982 Transcript_12429/m.21982 type:complete len:88 (+) Transcript_12429:219-482(+)